MSTDKPRVADANKSAGNQPLDPQNQNAAASPAPTGADGAAVDPAAPKAPRAPFEPSFSWDDPIKLMKSLGWAWREVTDRETPTFLQLVELGVLRVDVDEPTGFIAVHTDGEAHHAIGLRREAIVPLAAVLTGRSADEVKRAISGGPAKLEAVKKEPKKKRAAEPESEPTEG